MIPLTLAEIASALATELAGTDAGAAAIAPTGVVRIDSRDLDPGDVFACVRGGELDGHDFVEQALSNGAVLSIAERTVAGPHVVVPDVVAALAVLARAALDRRAAVTVLAVTGSSGKTSTKDLLAHVLEQVAPTVSPPGSFNNELGLPMTVLRTADDTRFLVLEMGARGVGHVRALCAIAPPRVGIVLNVGSAHLGEFGDRETVATAKGELVESLPVEGTAVLNADDPAVLAMAARTKARVVTFALGGSADARADVQADVRAEDVAIDSDGRASFTLVMREGSAPVRLRVVGAHQVSNSLAVAAAAGAVGVPVSEIAASLSGAEPRSRWRMEVGESAGGVVVINDAYNANPESVSAALESLVTIGDGRRTWAVLGEMRELGAGAVAAHEGVGRQAAELGVARIVVVGEAAAPIATGAAEGRAVGGGAATVERVDDIGDAIALLRAQIAPGDVVLVKASRAVGLERVAEALLESGALLEPADDENDPDEEVAR